MAKTPNNIQPLFDYVLVKPLEQTQTTPSGIVLPDSVKEKPQVGQVMAVGPGTVNDHGQKVAMDDRHNAAPDMNLRPAPEIGT